MKAVIIGTGLGGLTSALRLRSKGYEVEMVEKHHQAGGRLNQLRKDGFTFDLGPTFFSMSYEFHAFAREVGITLPFKFIPLDSLYTVHFFFFFRRFKITKDLDLLEREFEGIEPDFRRKMEGYLRSAGVLFHDVEGRIIHRNFDSLASFFASMASVPPKHLPLLVRSLWDEMSRHFSSYEVKVIFSLVAFFLGATPFDTPAIYKVLTYTEMVHDGYFNVEGGMYRIVEGLVDECRKAGIGIRYNTEVVGYKADGGRVVSFTDQHGMDHRADVFVSNADAAWFRGRIMGRPRFSDARLDKQKWTLGPFTMYLGVKGKIPGLDHHNYFLGTDFESYSKGIFKNQVGFDKPYYYVLANSKTNPETAPEGCENLFILCPVPDLRFKPDWSDRDEVASHILRDLSGRIGFDVEKNLISKTILDPRDWGEAFNLFRGSGLGLAHDLRQVGGFRPRNRDEQFPNLYYVGASTTPGTGLPMVVISSKLTTNQILKHHGAF